MIYKYKNTDHLKKIKKIIIIINIINRRTNIKNYAFIYLFK